jgi:RNA polymerase sigma-70 factor (ECF subfamily)
MDPIAIVPDAAPSVEAATPDVPAMTRAMKRGDETAFQQFYDRYYDRLYRYVMVLARGDVDRTREVLQNTLIVAARSIKPLPDEGALWRWLTTLARHRLIDLVRKQRRGPAVVPLFEAETLAHAGLDPREAGMEQSLERHLSEALASMEEEERALIHQFYFEANSQLALAEAQGTTVKAIASKLARVREKLRQSILKRLQHENA